MNTINRRTFKNYTGGEGGIKTFKKMFDFSVKELFVAVGKEKGTDPTKEKGIILTSDNEKDWTLAKINEPDIKTLNGVCYGNRTFVAVSENGKTIFSTDGVNWIKGSNYENNWSSVCYGNNRFVAVASNGPNERIMISNDGKDWNAVRVEEGEKEEEEKGVDNEVGVAEGERGRHGSVLALPNFMALDPAPPEPARTNSIASSNHKNASSSVTSRYLDPSAVTGLAWWHVLWRRDC
jgi:hypothetical protein